jgi:hypothetical protein
MPRPIAQYNPTHRSYLTPSPSNWNMQSAGIGPSVLTTHARLCEHQIGCEHAATKLDAPSPCAATEATTPPRATPRSTRIVSKICAHPYLCVARQGAALGDPLGRAPMRTQNIDSRCFHSHRARFKSYTHHGRLGEYELARYEASLSRMVAISGLLCWLVCGQSGMKNDDWINRPRFNDLAEYCTVFCSQLAFGFDVFSVIVSSPGCLWACNGWPKR